MHLYPGNGSGGWLAPSRVGSGWQIFDKIIAAGDSTGDGTADIFARDRSGFLYLYPTQRTWRLELAVEGRPRLGRNDRDQQRRPLRQVIQHFQK
ncbi:hypothetical protein ACIQTW_05955 [Paenarthrobacter sp. NPDC090517]|uniref:hypothetical protein n=1 Tax=Paenarthrobacter sp. NPDC090517 TaxID=3364381 RepID=UPI0037F7C7C9